MRNRYVAFIEKEATNGANLYYLLLYVYIYACIESSRLNIIYRDRYRYVDRVFFLIEKCLRLIVYSEQD